MRFETVVSYDAEPRLMRQWGLSKGVMVAYTEADRESDARYAELAKRILSSNSPYYLVVPVCIRTANEQRRGDRDRYQAGKC